MTSKSDVVDALVEQGIPYGVAAVAADVAEEAAKVAFRALNTHCDLLADQEERVLARCIGMAICASLMQSKAEILPLAIIALNSARGAQ